MPRCPECGLLISVHQSRCPACERGERATDARAADARVSIDRAADDRPLERVEGEEFEVDAEPDHGKRVAVAHFGNGAEAGYFAEELAHETGIDVQVLVREHFNHMWTTDYVLTVPEADAPCAADMLRGLLQATSEETDENTPALAPQFLAEGSTLGGTMWISVVMTLAAGSLAWWGINRLEQGPPPPALVMPERLPPADLYEFLKASPAPWVQQLDSGAREFQIDAHTRAATIREDRDGDGRFERKWEFHW